MICPECMSKLYVKDSREDGFQQIRLRYCIGKDCTFESVTIEVVKNQPDTEELKGKD